MKYIQGDILKLKDGYIMQTCDCISVVPHGWNGRMNIAYPNTCPYSFRKPINDIDNVSKKENRSEPGTLSIIKSLSGPAIINIFSYYCSAIDTQQERKEYFSTALEGLIDFFQGSKENIIISVPGSIGNLEQLQSFEKHADSLKINLEISVYF